MESCKDCIQIKNIERRLDDLKQTVDSKGDDFERRITELQRKSDVEHERTSMLFKMLGEIKESLKTIAEKLDTLDNKDGENYNKIKIAIITSAATGIIGVAIGKLLI